MENTISTLGNTQRKAWITEKISLHCSQLYRIQNHNKAMQIQGVEGTLYVTLPNDPEDYILKPGDQLVVRSRGLVLVQGLPEGAFRYLPG